MRRREAMEMARSRLGMRAWVSRRNEMCRCGLFLFIGQRCVGRQILGTGASYQLAIDRAERRLARMRKRKIA